MITLSIDNQTVQVPEGATILEAAQAAGITIPTLCHLKGFEPSTSCMVCVVHVENVKSLVPACGAVALDHMRVKTDSDEIRGARRAALELLLSDHLGDCLGPCQMGCPAGMDIPRMLRYIAEDNDRAAIEVIKRDIPLPAILGRICPAPCEKVCRRAKIDQPVAICRLKRFAADIDLDCGEPFAPPTRSNKNKKVAIVGAGPCGLSAAYYLAGEGIVCVIYDEHAHPGGALRYGAMDRTILPVDIVDREIKNILQHNITFKPQQRIGKDIAFDSLCEQYDAVLVATGDAALYDENDFALEAKNDKICIDRARYSTSRTGVFAAGGATGSRRLAVRAVGDAKAAAHSIAAFLAGETIVKQNRFNSRMGALSAEELDVMLNTAGAEPRQEPEKPHAGYGRSVARTEAQRCLHCDCRKADNCRLRDMAQTFGADQRLWKGQRKTMRLSTDGHRLVYEPGKCIQCGLCVQTAGKAGETTGLAFSGRGFAMSIAVPFDKSLGQALACAGPDCVKNCPTAALSWR